MRRSSLSGHERKYPTKWRDSLWAVLATDYLLKGKRVSARGERHFVQCIKCAGQQHRCGWNLCPAPPTEPSVIAIAPTNAFRLWLPCKPLEWVQYICSLLNIISCWLHQKKENIKPNKQSPSGKATVSHHARRAARPVIGLMYSYAALTSGGHVMIDMLPLQ